MVRFAFDQFFQGRFRAGAGGQDPFHGAGGKGTVADGAFQRGPQVGDGIGAQQGQDLLGLAAAVALPLDQSFPEAQGHRSQSGEALLQLGVGQARVGRGMVGGLNAALAADGAG